MNPKIQFIQNAILLAVHKGCTIEEAREKESLYFGCLGKYNGIFCYDFNTIRKSSDGFTFDVYSQNGGIQYFVKKEYIKIFGLPPTLPRLLYALGEEYYFWNGIRHAEKISNNYENRKYITDRKLLNENGTEATLLDQSQDTIDNIALLLGYK